MITYNKLVRDKIPDIITEAGQQCKTRIIESRQEFIFALETKLQEELAEYQKSGSTEELADILEVIFALANQRGVSKQELLNLAQQKAEKRGGFERGIILIAADEPK